jgi:aspartyl-tRNA(Asn)/glutamyl-tRNA(Gln) amidotransferase subunit C
MEKDHVSKNEVEYIARLACIELSEEEKELYAAQFNEILAYFEKIDLADTQGVSPTYHVLNLVNVFREDKTLPSMPVEAVLRNTGKKEKRYFRAPRIL